jgi:hypothetical protein
MVFDNIRENKYVYVSSEVVRRQQQKLSLYKYAVDPAFPCDVKTRRIIDTTQKFQEVPCSLTCGLAPPAH